MTDTTSSREAATSSAEHGRELLAACDDVHHMVVLGGSDDPVAVYDAMHEAGTSLMGSYVWLADHAASPAETDRWWAAYAEVMEERARVDARDVTAQRQATAQFIQREQAVRHLVHA